MTEALGRGIVAGIELTKPELLQVILQLGLKGEKAAEELVNALKDGRVMMAIGTENFGVIGNTLISGSAIVTCGISGISMTTTTSPMAKTFMR
jgi:branched-subunit amino acid permease